MLSRIQYHSPSDYFRPSVTSLCGPQNYPANVPVRTFLRMMKITTKPAQMLLGSLVLTAVAGCTQTPKMTTSQRPPL